MRVLLYFGCLFAMATYAAWRGGKVERCGALLLLVGSLLTLLAGSSAARRFADVETGILLVDVAVLLGFLALALFSDRYWTLWTAALQLIGVLGHLAKLADLEMPRTGYGFLQAVWSYPMMLVIVIGVRTYDRGTIRRSAGRTSPGS